MSSVQLSDVGVAAVAFTNNGLRLSPASALRVRFSRRSFRSLVVKAATVVSRYPKGVNVPLTPKGVEEAIEAGKRICNIPINVIYTSSLIRSQMTAILAMMQHRRKKVPIIMHNDSEQTHRWSQIYSEYTKRQSIPVITAWQLNERMYGELQGLNKQETADWFGKEQVHKWRRSYDIPPPNGEGLEMCAERAVAYFNDQMTAVDYAPNFR